MVAQQERYDDGGTHVVKPHGHPGRRVARKRIREAYQEQSPLTLAGSSGANREQTA